MKVARTPVRANQSAIFDCLLARLYSRSSYDLLVHTANRRCHESTSGNDNKQSYTITISVIIEKQLCMIMESQLDGGAYQSDKNTTDKALIDCQKSVTMFKNV